jgi:hypothetical protein
MFVFEGKYIKNALYFKNLFDMLSQMHPTSSNVNNQNNTISSTLVRRAFFKIHNNGMQIYSNVESDSVWILATFDRHSFEQFNLNFLNENEHCRELNLAVDLELIKSFFKNVKKNDFVFFRILFDALNEQFQLEVEIVKKNENIVLKNIMVMNKVQSINLNSEVEIGHCLTCKNSEFSTFFKNINHVNNVDIYFSDNNCKFIFNNNDISKTMIVLGENLQNDKYSYFETFNATYFKQINKISSFGTTLKMYAMNKHPLMFVSKIENVGQINIWVKSNSLTTNDHDS